MQQLRCTIFASNSFPARHPAGASVVPPLERWQIQKLRAAAVAGRKRVEIQSLCKETHLDRRIVLQWLKDYERHAVERPAQQSTQSSEATVIPQNVGASSSTHDALSQPALRDVEEPTFSKPARKFSKSAEGTLELVFSRTSQPSEEMIMSVVELLRVPKRQVLDWFAERRQFSQGTGRRPQRARRAVRPRQ